MSCLIEFRWGAAVYARVEWHFAEQPDGEEGVLARLGGFLDDVVPLVSPAGVEPDPGALAGLFVVWAAQHAASRIHGSGNPRNVRSAVWLTLRIVEQAAWCDASHVYAVDCRVLGRPSVSLVVARAAGMPPPALMQVHAFRFVAPDDVPAGAHVVTDPRVVEGCRDSYVGQARSLALWDADLEADMRRWRDPPPTPEDVVAFRAALAADFESYSPSPERTVLVRVLLPLDPLPAANA